MTGHRGPVAAAERGHAFEGWFAAVLRAYRDYRRLFDDCAYRAPGKGSSLEVDFLLSRGKDLVAIETKASRRVDAADLRGLKAIGDLRAVRRRLVVYLGDQRMKTAEGIEILPVSTVLDELATTRLFP